MLARGGVTPLRSDALPDRMDNAVVIIRAHGVPPETLRSLESRGCRVVDATCPRVKTSQKKAFDARSRGESVFLVGERTHAELVGIAGYAPDSAIVASAAEAAEEAERLHAVRPDARVTLIAQTTISAGEYEAIAQEFLAVFPGTSIERTICPATADRLAALESLCAECEAVVVVGGKESANTRRLHTRAVELGMPTWHIEEVEDLPAEVFAYGRVGITAGASTPDEAIDAVEAALHGRAVR